MARPGVRLLGLGLRHHGRLPLCDYFVSGHERGFCEQLESAVIGFYGGIVLEHLHDRLGLRQAYLSGPLPIGMDEPRPWRLRFSFTHRLPLSAASPTWQELAIYRFLTGLGIGGEWAAGVALIAESFPEKSRTKAAGIMQASGGIGFFLATGLYLLIGPYGWRWVFALGVLPRDCRIYIRKSLDEPERWVKAERIGILLPALFTESLRRDVLIGTGLAVVATFGHQGAIQWVPSWIADYAARSRDARRDPAGESGYNNTDHRRNHRLLMFAACRRSLGERAPCLFIFSVPILRSDDVFACHRIQPCGSRGADHGILCLWGNRRLCDLFSRIVSDRHPRHGARFLF